MPSQSVPCSHNLWIILFLCHAYDIDASVTHVHSHCTITQPVKTQLSFPYHGYEIALNVALNTGTVDWPRQSSTWCSTLSCVGSAVDLCMEPPLQRRRKPTSQLTPKARRVVDEYILLGDQSKFANNVKYRTKVSRPSRQVWIYSVHLLCAVGDITQIKAISDILI